MGKKRRRYNNNNKNNKKKPKSWINITEDDMHNEIFDRYYKEQKIINNNEWDEFNKILHTRLPITFRINDLEGNAHVIKSTLESKNCFNIEEKQIMYNNKIVKGPQPLSWYPNNMAWYFPISRHELRKYPDCKLFHEFLKQQDIDFGTINRQEAVSMIPPLFLDVQPHHYVIDLCASPGSKTAQLIHAMHKNNELPTGFVLANDVDRDRAYMMVHRLKKLSSPTILVSLKEAQHIPNMWKREYDDENKLDNWHDIGPIKYDRILADVPCTGDGTLRKNITIWKTFHALQGIAIHPLQLQIALKGVYLLKSNGIMVYSTCSLNPIEDEAVVCELLRRYPDTLELVDTNNMMPTLKRCHGLSTWKVPKNKNATEFYENVQQVEENNNKFYSSMFPPTDEEAKKFHLERCMRFLPHHQDTGGFFVAVLKKIGPSHIEEETTNELREKYGKLTSGPESQRDSFVVLESKTDQSLRDFYGLSKSLPRHTLFTRSDQTTSEQQKIYFMTKSAAKILASGMNNRIIFQQAGVRVFEATKRRDENAAMRYRLCQDGIYRLLPYISKQIAVLKSSDMLKVLDQQFTFPLELNDDHVTEMVNKAEKGAFVFVMREVNGKWPKILTSFRPKNEDDYEQDNNEQTGRHTVALVGLLSGYKKFTPMVNKADRAKIRHLIADMTKSTV